MFCKQMLLLSQSQIIVFKEDFYYCLKCLKCDPGKGDKNVSSLTVKYRVIDLMPPISRKV